LKSHDVIIDVPGVHTHTPLRELLVSIVIQVYNKTLCQITTSTNILSITNLIGDVIIHIYSNINLKPIC